MIGIKKRRKEQKIKGAHITKEIRLPSFADDIIFFLETPRK